MFLPLLVIAQSLFSFGLDLSKPLQSPQQNTVYSPLSISTTLGMCAVGAKDKTYQEMIDALHFEGSQEALGTAFRELLTSVKDTGTEFPKHLFFDLQCVLWMQKDFQFLPLYQSDIVKDFSGELRSVDFTKPGNAIFEINKWFLDKTSGFTGPLFGPNDLSPTTRLVAISTLYLRSHFEKPFDSSHTRIRSFHVNDKQEVPVNLMYQKNEFPYYKGESFEAVSLDYLPLSRELSLWIILPKSFDKFKLNQEVFSEIRSGLTPAMMELEIPRFRIETSINLIPVLQDLGIHQAFTTGANFSLITEANNLMISDFRHKALVIVDEEGTTAEAATSASFGLKALPPQKSIQFVADKPFIFMILDKKNSIPLFIGQLIDPKGLINH